MARLRRHDLGRTLAQYLLAALLVTGAAGITRAFWDLLHNNVSLLFITAIMLSAMYGGLGPGLLAGALASASTAFFFLEPARSFHLDSQDLLRLAVFVLTAALVSGLNGARKRNEEELRHARQSLESQVGQRTAALVSANDALQDEIAERRSAQEQILAYQRRLQALATELSVGEERERRRIAAMLHDGIGHRLAVVKMKAQELALDLPQSHPSLRHVLRLIDQAICDTRTLTLQLSPPILYELGLVPAVEWLAEQTNQEHGLQVNVIADRELIDVAEEVRPLLFSAVRELLMNVVKHSGASRADVRIGESDEMIEIVVSDDGRGCDPARLNSATDSGFGLFNLRERVTHLGGQFHAEAPPGGGCRVGIRVPSRVSSLSAVAAS